MKKAECEFYEIIKDLHSVFYFHNAGDFMFPKERHLQLQEIVM